MTLGNVCWLNTLKIKNPRRRTDILINWWRGAYGRFQTSLSNTLSVYINKKWKKIVIVSHRCAAPLDILLRGADRTRRGVARGPVRGGVRRRRRHARPILDLSLHCCRATTHPPRIRLNIQLPERSWNDLFLPYDGLSFFRSLSACSLAIYGMCRKTYSFWRIPDSQFN